MQGLRAMVPINVRVASEHLALGNRCRRRRRASLFWRELPMAQRDPVRRYRNRERLESLKSTGNRRGHNCRDRARGPGATGDPAPADDRRPAMRSTSADRLGLMRGANW